MNILAVNASHVRTDGGSRVSLGAAQLPSYSSTIFHYFGSSCLAEKNTTLLIIHTKKLCLSINLQGYSLFFFTLKLPSYFSQPMLTL